MSAAAPDSPAGAGLSRFVRIWSTTALAALAVAAAARPISSVGGAELLLGLLVLGSVMVAELMPVRIAPNQKASLASVPLLLGALLLPPVEAGLVAWAGVSAGNLGMRRSFRNSAFNAGSATLAVLLAAVVASPLRVTGEGLVAALLGALGFSVVSLAAPSTAAAFQRHEPVLSSFRSILAGNWAQALAFDAMAISVALLGRVAPLAAVIPLLFLPLILRMNLALEGQLTANETLRKVLGGQRRFLTDVSHNVANPLATIRMNLDLLQGVPVRAVDKVALGDARAEAARLSELFQRLRLLAETDEEVPLHRASLDLAEMADDLVRTYSGSAGRKGVELTWETTGRIEIEGDENLIRQAAANLLENAIRLTPRGKSVRLRVSRSNRLARFEVIDEGPGIEPDLLPDIFDRFKKGPQGGSGLGLAIARSVVERHGGQISVDSTPGSGARFEIRLPAVAGHPTPAG